MIETGYTKMRRNQMLLIDIETPNWCAMSRGRVEWEYTDCVMETNKKQRLKFEQRVYRLMRRREKIRYPSRRLINGSEVKIKDGRLTLGYEVYTERWLVHYYHLRHFQPCREVSSFVAGRMTGEYHEGNDVSFELDVERLCAAREILNRKRKA